MYACVYDGVQISSKFNVEKYGQNICHDACQNGMPWRGSLEVK